MRALLLPLGFLLATLNFYTLAAELRSTRVSNDSYTTVEDMAVDAEGNTYVCGITFSASAFRGPLFPLGPVNRDGKKADGFLAKVSRRGNVQFVTLFGGGEYDYPRRIVVATNGDIIVCGATASTNFPLRNALQTNALKSWTGFVCRFDSSGTNLVFSTRIGGGATALALGSNGDIFVGGVAETVAELGTTARFGELSKTRNGYVLRLAADGQTVLYSSLVAAAEVAALTVDDLGAVYVVGSGYPGAFPIVNGLSVQPFDGYGDAFLFKLSPDGQTLVFSTLFGGRCFDRAAAVKLDAVGNIHVAGTTCSQSFGDFFSDPADPLDYRDHGFVAKFDPGAKNILATNFFKLSQRSEITSLAIKADGTVFAGGAAFGGYATPGLPLITEISPSGVVLAQEVFNNCGTLASVSAIGLDSVERLYVSGRSSPRNDTVAASTFVASLRSPASTPQVRLATPFERRVVAPGESVEITAVMLNLPGATVRFYDGNKLIGVASNAPFSVTWSNSVRGVHSLAAVAQNADAVAKSCRVHVRAKRPLNDDFRRRIRLRRERAFVKGSNEGATVEAGERYRSYPTPSESVWWTWIAPRDGVFRFSLGTFSLSQRLEVLTGSFIESLESVASVNAYDSAAIRVRKNQVFQIAVTSSGVTGRFQFAIEPADPPANDDFANRIDIGTSSNASGTVRDATVETGEQAVFPNNGSVWYSWTAPTSGVFAVTCTFDPSASLFGMARPRPSSATFAVFTGDNIAGLIKVSTDERSRTVTFPAVAGAAYVLGIARDYGSAGKFQLRIEQVSGPANDNFDSRAVLTSAEVLVQESTLTATREPAEPAHGWSTNSPSIWWSWTAPTSGLYAVVASRSFYWIPSPGISGDALVVYTGSSMAELTRIAGTSSSQGLLLEATGGETYAIVYAGPAEFSVTLDIHPTTRPKNDNFASAVPLTGAYVIAAGTTLNSTLETNELEQSYLGSVWYRWIAPSNGTYAMDTQYVPLAIYIGNTLEELVPAGIGTYSRQILHATAGNEFRIAVLRSSYSESFRLRIFPVVLPVNDEFTNRIVLLGSDITFLSNGRDSSADPDEPPHGGHTAENSVWWSWVAPSNGIVAFEVENYSRIGIYTGAGLAHLQYVVGIAGSKLTFTATAGTEYAIAIDSPARQNVRLRYVPRPANDNFAEAQRLSGATATIRTANAGASVEPDEPMPGYNRADKSLWWSFTPSKTQSVLFSTEGSGFYTVLAIYTGSSVTNLTPVASATGGAPDGRAWVAVRLSAGTQYFILIDGTDPAQFGETQLALKPVALPPNDDFARRLAMRDDSATGALTGATAESAEPDFEGVYRPTVWWTWTAPANGTYLIRERNSLSLALFEGNVLSNLASVVLVERPSGSFGPRQFVFHATQGTTYAVRVSSWFGTVANVDLSIGLFPAGNNDAFANRIRLEPWDTLSTSWNFEATTEPGEPALYNGAGHTLWWQWTAPGSVSLQIDPTTSDIPCVIEVFTGANLTDLIPVSLTTTGVTGAVSLSVTQGQTYYIRADSYSAAAEQRGRIVLRTHIVHILPPRPIIAQDASTENARSSVQLVRRFDGLAELNVSATSGAVIETSTNLHDWTPFATNQISGHMIVIPTQAERQQFFRVR